MAPFRSRDYSCVRKVVSAVCTQLSRPRRTHVGEGSVRTQNTVEKARVESGKNRSKGYEAWGTRTSKEANLGRKRGNLSSLLWSCAEFWPNPLGTIPGTQAPQ